MSFLTDSSSFAYPTLVADIGGTNARFALVEDVNSATKLVGKTATASHADICSAITSLVSNNESFVPKSAIIAVAGPVSGDQIPLTNANWVIEPLKMIQNLGLEEVVVLNDFEAQALALPGYRDKDVTQLGGTHPNQDATKFVLGPGTGLGASAMIYAAGTWVPVAGEGGHVELGPVTEEDYLIWPLIEKVGGRLGAEQLLSGTGLPRLAKGVSLFLRQERNFQTAAEVTTAAEANDPVALKTLDVFSRSLGRVAGDFALSILARGGVYLTGGITPRIKRFLSSGTFRSAFEAKAPHNNLMTEIPVFIVEHENPALEGLASFARDPSRFVVEMQGRRWLANHT